MGIRHLHKTINMITMLMLILFFRINSNQIKQYQNLSQSGDNFDKYSIYGVRWFVGDSFSYAHQNQQSANYYILCFNSDQRFSEDVFVKIHKTKYTCTRRRVEVDNIQQRGQEQSIDKSNQTIIELYRCHISQNLWEIGKSLEKVSQPVELNYEIYISRPEFLYKTQQQSDKAKNEDGFVNVNRGVVQQVISLFKGKFRPVPTSNQVPIKFLSLGDWGQVENSQIVETLPNLITKFQEDSDIIMVLFLGDLAYDFYGEKYFSMLQYIQPLTSRICFMTTPGNHDYIYHQDAFELFAETFLSPQWDKYYNFYYTMIIGDLMLLSYSPQNILYEQKYKVNVSPIEYINQDLNKSIMANTLDQHPYIANISEKYHVITFSHYPIYCSENQDLLNSCQLNEQRLSKYIKAFQQMGMDLYISAHEHYYERTHQICFDKIQDSQNDVDHQVIFPEREDSTKGAVYKGECPLYIVDGTGGNKIFMDPEGQITPKKFTANLSFGPGFGFMEYYPQNSVIGYTHYKIIQPHETIIQDKFTKVLQQINPKNEGYLKYVQVFFVVSWVMLFAGICLCRHQCATKKRQQQRQFKEHVQMVEQNFHTIRSSNLNSETKSKQDELPHTQNDN